LSVSRVLLHLAAALLPMAAVAVITQFKFHSGSEFVELSIPAVLAAELAALIGWPMFEGAAQRGGGWRAALTGVVMGVLTHLLFGPLLMLFGGGASDAFAFMFAVSVGSLLVVGWVSIPILIVLDLVLVRLRRKELQRAAV
jgi:hypothetical protein